MQHPADTKRILEAALLASQEPLGIAGLKQLFDGEVSAETLRALVAELREDWNGRAVELVSLASGGGVQVGGKGDAGGRPELLATTKKFLDDLGLRSLQELPPLEEIAKTLPLEPAPAETAAAPDTGTP